jgi:hypothetical protein
LEVVRKYQKSHSCGIICKWRFRRFGLPFFGFSETQKKKIFSNGRRSWSESASRLGAGASKWVISIQGGGWCATESQCRYRSGGDLGSSNGYPASVASFPATLSSDSVANPDFYNWNHVYIPYCSGDLHSGTRMTNSSETWGLHFSGHNNFLAIIEYLESYFRLGAATDIVVTGESAGAVGSWIHAEGVASRFPSARVVNIPNAGYFTAEILYPAGDLISRVDLLRNQSAVWQSFVPASCGDSKAAENKWTCLLSVI